MRNWMMLLLASLSFIACKKEVDQVAEDFNKIESYLQDNNLSAEEHPSGLFYIINPQGTGINPSPQDEVTVKYKGYLLDGSVFDETKEDQTISFRLSNVIPGWQIAIPLLKEGGKGTFLIPSYLGYGNNPPPRSIIGRNEVLIFDVELIKVK